MLIVFENRRKMFCQKNLLECESFSYQEMKWKKRILDDFLWKLLWTTGSIERIVMIDFKMGCLYVRFSFIT